MGAPVAKQIITLKKTLRQPSPGHRSSLLRPCVSICLSSYFTGEFGSILHCPPNFTAFSMRPVFSILYTVVRDTPIYSAYSSGDIRRARGRTGLFSAGYSVSLTILLSSVLANTSSPNDDVRQQPKCLHGHSHMPANPILGNANHR